MISVKKPPHDEMTRILVRPYRSDRAPSFGDTMALSPPVIIVMYRVNLVTSVWTAGISHCGLSSPRRTGAKMREGSMADCSMKYSLQTRDLIRLSFGTRMPPNARAKRKKGGINHPTYSLSVHESKSSWEQSKLTDGVRHQGKPSKSARPSHSSSLLLPFSSEPLPLPLPLPSNGVASSSSLVPFFLRRLPALRFNESFAPQFSSGLLPFRSRTALSPISRAPTYGDVLIVYVERWYLYDCRVRAASNSMGIRR